MNQITWGTPIGPKRCLDVVRGVASPLRDERDEWSGAVSFWDSVGEIDVYESRILSAVLGWAAVTETEIDNDGLQKWVRSSLLDALDCFAEAGDAPLDVLEDVAAAIPPPDRRIFELDFIEPIDIEIDRLRSAQPQPAPSDVETARSPIGPEHAVLLVRGITSPWPFPRQQSAHAVTELCATGHLDRREADTLAGVLSWAVVTEAGIPEVRGQLLAALGMLSGAGLVSTDTRTRLSAHLAPGDLHPQERPTYDEILTDAPPADGA